VTAKSIKHKFQSSVTDGTDATLVRPSNWNDDHDFWLGFRAVTSTTDTIVHADHFSLITYNNGSGVAVTLPAPSGGNMPLGWKVTLRNINSSGNVSFTLTGGATINGSASPPVLKQFDTVEIRSLGTSDYVGIYTSAPAAPVAGGPVLLNTMTAASSAALTDNTSFTSTYNAYEIVIDSLLPATNNTGLQMTIRSNGVNQTTGYNSMVSGAFGLNSIATKTVGNGAAMILADPNTIFNGIMNTGKGAFGSLKVKNANGITAVKIFQGWVVWDTSAATTTPMEGGQFHGECYADTHALQGITISPMSGNLTSGNVKIYGLPGY